EVEPRAGGRAIAPQIAGISGSQPTVNQELAAHRIPDGALTREADAYRRRGCKLRPTIGCGPVAPHVGLAATARSAEDKHLCARGIPERGVLRKRWRSVEECPATLRRGPGVGGQRLGVRLQGLLP